MDNPLHPLPGHAIKKDGTAALTGTPSRRPTDATRTRSLAIDPTSELQPTAAAPTEYDFLGPAQAADELGRLGGYRVLGVLGEGGMGVVFEAEDILLCRRIALKAMKPRLAAKADARQRFVREAQTAASVEHENIVTIYQVGDDRGIPFIAMPLLRGETLADRIHRQGESPLTGPSLGTRRNGAEAQPLPLADILRISREIAAGLAAAHGQGLVHRDITPANIWLEAKTGRVKLLDFGLARAAGEDRHWTYAGGVIGTPSYMSPEQARGEAAEYGTDLFSLGCVLYHIATGRRPFRGASTVSTLLAVATIEPAAPKTMNPRLPEQLQKLIRELMSKQRSSRPANAEQVVERLLAIERSAAEGGLPRRWRTSRFGNPHRARSSGRLRRPRARRHLLLAALGVAALLVASMLASLGSRGPMPDRAEYVLPIFGTPSPGLGADDSLASNPKVSVRALNN